MSRPPRNLSKDDILEAFRKSKSIFGAARYCNCTDKTFRKYANMYVPDMLKAHSNQGGKGMRKVFKNRDIKKIIKGEHNGQWMNKYWLKERLVKEMLLIEKCSVCGFSEKRITDEKAPLLIDYIDGDTRNHLLANLRLLCYNCTFLTVGNLKGKYKKEYIYDPMDGHIIDVIDFHNIDPKNLEE